MGYKGLAGTLIASLESTTFKLIRNAAAPKTSLSQQLTSLYCVRVKFRIIKYKLN